MTDFRISLGFIVVVLYPVKKSLSILIARSPSTNIKKIITVIMMGILPTDAKFSVAPLANSTGFKSDIGLAVMMFPAKDYDAHIIIHYNYLGHLQKHFVFEVQQTT